MNTHRERARWLLSVPLDVIARDHATISAICRDAGFRPGVAYVAVELVALTAKRRGGELSAWHDSMVQTVRAMLRQEAGYPSKSWFYRWKFW